MLDKSLPYAGFYMRRKAGTQSVSFPLPDGFRFALWNDGDENSWARIETSVLEFDAEFAALMYFMETYMPYSDELRRRCLFVENSDGLKVATSTAWWKFVGGERRPFLHWVAADPQYQGLGLGRAIISNAVRLMVELEGDVDFFLHTQTWSHKAVKIYNAHGFEPTDEKALYCSSIDNSKDNYKSAMKILKRFASARGKK